MALKVFAGISLRNDDGVHFGTLVRIRTGLAGVQTDAHYQLGERVEFQLELLGFETMVQGIAEVVRADPHPDDLSSYLLRVRKMRRSDQALLQEWYEQQLAGMEPSLRGDDEGRALDSQVESQLPSDIGADLPERAKLADGRGREAVRNLLVDAAPEGGRAGETGGAASDAPAVALDLSCAPPRLLVAYRTQGAWQRARDEQFKRGMFFVPLEDGQRPALDSEVLLHIQRPPQRPIEGAAVVVLLHDRGMGLRLDLDPAALD